MYELIKAYEYFKFLRRTRKEKIRYSPIGDEYVTRKEFDALCKKHDIKFVEES